MLSQAIDLLLYTAMMFTKNYALMIVILLSFGFMTPLRINVGYVYLMEMMPRKAMTPVTSTWNVQESLIYVFATLYFW